MTYFCMFFKKKIIYDNNPVRAVKVNAVIIIIISSKTHYFEMYDHVQYYYRYIFINYIKYWIIVCGAIDKSSAHTNVASLNIFSCVSAIYSIC